MEFEISAIQFKMLRQEKPMMTSSHASLPVYLRSDHLSPECIDLMSSLPRDKGWIVDYLYEFQGSCYPPAILQGVLNCQKHFEAKDTDILIATIPKSGTTWLKALVFAVVHRHKFQDSQENHPLLTNNPHALVPYLEGVYYRSQDLSYMASPRMFNTHMPHVSLPESVKGSSCKIVYCCRNPKDVFVSLWHFWKKLIPEGSGSCQIEDLLSQFCKGSSFCGQFWDHALGYWKLSQEKPKKVLFLMYEEIKEQPELQLKRLANFLGCPFTEEEEEANGSIADIVKLCSFENLSNLEANKKGTVLSGINSNAFFRKGEIGGWKNTLTSSMAEEIDRVTEEKLRGSGFKFPC